RDRSSLLFCCVSFGLRTRLSFPPRRSSDLAPQFEAHLLPDALLLHLPFSQALHDLKESPDPLLHFHIPFVVPFRMFQTLQPLGKEFPGPVAPRIFLFTAAFRRENRQRRQPVYFPFR